MSTESEKQKRLEEIRAMLTAPYLVKAKEILKELRDNNPIDAIDTKAIIERNWNQ